MKKQEILELVQELPDEVDVEILMERLYVLRTIEIGEAAAAAGDVLTHEEVVRLTEEWKRE
jgi:predicted transcriptional regulator